MLGSMKKIALGVAAVAFAAVPSAFGTSVTFTTLGSKFLPPSGNYPIGSPLATVFSSGGSTTGVPVLPPQGTYLDGSLVAGAAGQTVFLATAPVNSVSPSTYLEITYTDINGNAGTTANPLPKNVELGQFGFATNVDPGTAEDLSGLQFVLQIDQTIPAPGGTTTSVSDITGTVVLTPTAFGAGPTQDIDLSIVFTGGAVYVAGDPTIAYNVDPNPINVELTAGDNPISDAANLRADVTVVPLPASFGTGLAMLSCLAGFAGIRRRIMA